ncbi:MAG: O-antigen ligase family protein [Dorea sp.]|jgi:O-antigen ligase|nr:O-antigen ligase family protein [Dorea sp.]
MGMILIFEIFFVCLNGGIYDYTFALYGVIFFTGIAVMAKRRNMVRIPRNITSYGLGVILLGHIVSVFLAEDTGTAVIGCLRIVMLTGFWILWNNLPAFLREQIIRRIPDTAAALTGLTILLYFVPAAREHLYQAGRMGGVFQYSNTYAVFLLVSFVILFYKEKPDKMEYSKAGILIAGIVYCGSRSVLVLTVTAILYLLISERVIKKRWIWLLGTALIVCVCIQSVMELDLGRFGKMTLDSSTLNGRFLYWKDSLPVIAAYPLGLGYMGYYFLQPQFQTGSYVTRFVHNDILQMGLDAGILPMIALIVMIAGNVWKLSCILHKEAKRNRTMLIVLAVHCLFDFDLQFVVMSMIMLMCMDGWEENACKWSGKCAGAVCAGILAAGSYFSIALGTAHFGMNEVSLILYPYYTSAREVVMEAEEGGVHAELLIETNGMMAEAYEYAAKEHLEKGEYIEACEDIQGMLKTAGYGIRYYNQGVYDLSICLDMAVRNEDYEGVKRILKEIRGIPELLDKLRERTSDLAYRINDKPVFDLDEGIKEYIENLSGISLT